MKEEAEIRKTNAEKIKQEDLDKKQKVKDKKMEIRKIIDGDIENKRNFKRNTAMHVKKSDFDDNNLFTNVYSTKEHRAFEMDKKKEHVIALMKNHFQSQDKLGQFNAALEGKNTDARQRAEEAQERKKIELKRKEMEAKLFQDQ